MQVFGCIALLHGLAGFLSDLILLRLVIVLILLLLAPRAANLHWERDGLCHHLAQLKIHVDPDKLVHVLVVTDNDENIDNGENAEA